MSPDPPLVSIVTRVSNVVGDVPEAVESLPDQDYGNIPRLASQTDGSALTIDASYS